MSIALRIPRFTLRHGYSWSVAIVAGATLLIWFLQYVLKLPQLSITPIYLVSILVCAAISGRKPAVLCAALGFVAFKFFFVNPIYTFTVDDAEDVVRLGIFLATAILGGGMVVWLREQALAAQQRADEAAALYELSQVISAELDFAAIAPRIVSTSRTLLGSRACELLLVGGAAPARTISGAWPPGASAAEARLLSGDQPLGVLRIALEPPQKALSAERQRLLGTLASQAALALERSQLVHAAAHAEALAESDRLKSTLLSAVSHDFRTPLAAIVAAADELLAEDVAWSPAAIADFAGVIRGEAARLNQLVTNLLDLTRIEAGVLQPQRGWYDVAEIIYSVLQRLAPRLHERALELAIPDDLPLLPIDYVQIEQVLWNVLENGLKYSPHGSPVLVAVQPEPAALCIRVGDRGPGIAQAERARVFTKFYRLPQPGTDRIAGMGIGLAICKGFIEAHGGQIALLERAQGGTLVEIRLPRELPGALVKQEAML